MLAKKVAYKCPGDHEEDQHSHLRGKCTPPSEKEAFVLFMAWCGNDSQVGVGNEWE